MGSKDETDYELAAHVHVGAEVYPAGSCPPPHIAEQITNPAAWKDGKVPPKSWLNSRREAEQAEADRAEEPGPAADTAQEPGVGQAAGAADAAAPDPGGARPRGSRSSNR